MKKTTPLFHIENYRVDTKKFDHLLHDKVVDEFTDNFCDYVGAKYGCAFNSATSAIFLLLLNKNQKINIPSVIPPVVCNAILTSGNEINFIDNVGWVGNSYVLHDFENYKVIDSAQKVERNQFSIEADPQDLMVFSFYPTKPIGSCDGGIVVSNDKKKIEWLKEASLNGTTFASDNWNRYIKFPGYKMYMNSIQAYIANENLKKLDKKYEALDKIREAYNQSFGLKNTSHHLYRINVSNRKELRRALQDEGFQTGIHYEAAHLNPVYDTGQINLFKSNIESKTTVSLCYNEKMKTADVQKIIKIVEKYANRC